MSNSQPKIKRAIVWALIAVLAIGQPAFAADQYGQVLVNGVPVIAQGEPVAMPRSELPGRVLRFKEPAGRRAS